MTDIAERFIRYARVSTQSQEDTGRVPSTERQFDLAHLLEQELIEMGLTEVCVTEHAYIYGVLPANVENAPSIAFCAHIDTALEVTGENVKPRIIKNYDGKNILLNAPLGIVMSPDKFPSLLDYVGKTLIVTDGTTLLGADDKAGIAEIMDAIEYMVDHPEYEHGKVVVCFCPDEEIGHGAALWDLEKYGADFAYTIDGGREGEFSYETFNAAVAVVTFKGVSVHPGSAKNQMINASLLAVEFASSLPAHETPAHTELREGFYHLTDMFGGVNEAKLAYIIRDHDTQMFKARKDHFALLVRQLNERYGAEYATLSMRDQYYNMAVPLSSRMDVVHTALKAYELCGVKPEVVATRGGTDGSQLSFRGLLTPNIFCGCHNCHGQYEYAVVESMQKASDIIRTIVNLYATGQQVL